MAINDHILLLMGSSLAAAYSTDDGATFTDLGTVFSDLDAANYYIGGLNGHRAACTDGATWLVMSGAGYWTSSIDSTTWTESTVARPLAGSEGGISIRAEDCIYIPARANPLPGTRRWHRWIMCGSTTTNNDPAVVSDDLPALAVLSLTTADAPLNGASPWVKVATPTNADFDTRNMRWKSMAMDPINYRLWILGIDYAAGNLVLAYVSRENLERSSGQTHLYLDNATSILPAELREGGNIFETRYTSGTGRLHYMVLDYDWRSQCLRLTVTFNANASVGTYQLLCGADYDTYDWATVANTPMAQLQYPGLGGTAGPYAAYVSAHPGNIHSEQMFGGVLVSSGVPTRYVTDIDAYQVDVDEPVMAIQTNGGATLLALFVDDGSTKRAVNRAAGARIDVEVNWTDTGIPNTGYPTVLIQAPSAAASLAAGVTLTAPAMTSWFAPAPEFCGVVFPDEIPTATATVWAAIAPSGFIIGLPLADTLLFSEEYIGLNTATAIIADALATSCAVVDAATFVLSSVAAFTGAPTDNITQRMAVVSSMALIDSLLLEWIEVLSDSMATTCVALPVHQKIAVLLDLMTLSGVATNRIEAVHALADALATACLLQVAPLETVSDTAAFADPVVDLIEAMEVLLDALDAADATVVSGRIVGVVADTMTIGTTLLSAMTMLDSLTDEVSFYTTFRIGDEVYRGYVLNAANKAASEYTNFAFNSMATLGRRPFAASSGGLYELTGDDDDGTIIESAVRTGIMAIAAGKQAQVISAYLGYTSTGTVVLKAILTSAGGEKREHWYRLDEQTADAMREGRFKLGLGLKSVYWAFEVCNVAGETLDLDNIKLHRIALDRRI